MSLFIKLVILLFCLPIFFVVFNPNLELGGLGILIGIIGTYISPFLLFGLVLYFMFFKNKDAAERTH